jgi:hypothetical protein
MSVFYYMLAPCVLFFALVVWLCAPLFRDYE